MAGITDVFSGLQPLGSKPFIPAPPGSYYDVYTGQIKPWDFSVNIQDTPGYKEARQYEIDHPTLKHPGSLPVPVSGGTTTYPVGSSSNQQVLNAITGLLTPGLVPDIARQSAEIAAGRGVGGSPAGGSTAVRMSEADWLTRLGLANTLLSGEAGRNLPYQITPLQQQQLALQQQQLQNQRDIGLNRLYANATRGYGQPSRYGYGGGGGGYGGGYNPAAYGGGGGLSSGYFGSPNYGSGGAAPPQNLNEVYDWLGFGNMGGQPGDWTNPPQSEGEFYDFIGAGQEPPDFNWDMWE